tara:strand:+ start:268 stop:651 length:384 start_codon:yes stop_codon:yes gene_type:complete
MAVNIDSYGISKTYNNGHLISGLNYDANYNGDELNLAIQNQDGKVVYMKMDNDDIMQLFNGPIHKKPLHERIENDFKTYKSHYVTKSKTKSKPKSKPKNKTKSRMKSRMKTFTPLNSYIKSIDKTIY